jgi:hypothetical protein
MLVSVFGDPSQDAIFATKAIQSLVENAFGSYHWIYEGTAADLATALAEASHRNVIFFSDAPDYHISKVFLEGNAPLVVLVHNPIRIVDSLILERKFDAITSTRLTSLSLSCLHDLVLCPRAYVISEPLDITNIAKHLTRLANVCRIPVDDVILEKAVKCLMPLGQNKARTNRGPDAMSACLESFESLLRKTAVNQICWPREVFLNADEQGAFVTAPVNLTGRARLFLYGPYLHVPRGLWIAEITFEIRENFSGNILKVDICFEEVAGEWKFQLPENGIYTFELSLKIFEPRHPVQIRFFLMEGAIEGSFDLKRVNLRRAQE